MKIIIGLIVCGFCLTLMFCFFIRERSYQLYMENKRFYRIFKASEDLVFCFSEKDRKYFWYGEWGKIFEKKDSERNLESILHPDDFPIILQQMADTGRGIVYHTETRLRLKEGHYEIFRCRMVPYEEKDIEKNRIHVVGFLSKVNKSQN